MSLAYNQSDTDSLNFVCCFFQTYFQTLNCPASIHDYHVKFYHKNYDTIFSLHLDIDVMNINHQPVKKLSQLSNLMISST